MSLTPYDNPITTDPGTGGAAPLQQGYYRTGCKETPVTADWLNEVIRIVNGPAAVLGVTEVPNDNSVLTKYFQRVLTGGLDFSVGNLAAESITSSGDVNTVDLNVSGDASLASLNVSGTTTSNIFSGNRFEGDLFGNSTGTHFGAVSGNASTATRLRNTRRINRVSFDGTADITVEPYIDTFVDQGVNYLTFTANNTPGHKRLRSNGSLRYDASTNTLNANITGQSADVSEGDFDTLRVRGLEVEPQEKGTFIPTFNGAPTATTRKGRYIKQGSRVELFMRIAGAVDQRAGLPANTVLEIGNLPFISQVLDSDFAIIKVLERENFYPLENVGPSQDGLLDLAGRVINLVNHQEYGRDVKEYGQWLNLGNNPTFDFYIHAIYLLG